MHMINSHLHVLQAITEYTNCESLWAVFKCDKAGDDESRRCIGSKSLQGVGVPFCRYLGFYRAEFDKQGVILKVKSSSSL